jgi:hypothetical protein
MLNLIFKLAALTDSVTMVFAKKGDIYHISISNSGIGDSKFKPVLVSGTEEQLIAELPNITEHFQSFLGHASNIKSIADKAGKKVAEKLESKTPVKSTGNAKSPQKPGTPAKTADLFGATEAAPTKESNDDEDNPEDENEELANSEEQPVVVQPETPTVTKAAPLVEEITEIPITNPLTEAPAVVEPAAEEEIF